MAGRLYRRAFAAPAYRVKGPEPSYRHSLGHRSWSARKTSDPHNRHTSPCQGLQRMGTAPLDWVTPTAAGRLRGRTEPAPESPSTCRRCPLWRNATQAVAGEGPQPAPLMLVGDQPCDVDDQQGRPFVGEAGQLLEQLMRQAGLDRSQAWMTIAVKHWKSELRDKGRVPIAPLQSEVSACKVWLDEEIRRVGPEVVVALGANTARALLGSGTTIERARRAGPVRLASGTRIVATYHPRAVLREPGAAKGAVLRAALLADLELAARLLGRGVTPSAVAANLSGAPQVQDRELGR
jgi:uracil-DNA glycosylase